MSGEQVWYTINRQLAKHAKHHCTHVFPTNTLVSFCVGSVFMGC